MMNRAETTSVDHGEPVDRGSWASEYLKRSSSGISAVPASAVADAIGELERVRRQDGLVWTVGNGGSATIASHLAIGLSLNARKSGGLACRAICLSTDGGALTAAANDFGPENAFAAQVGSGARRGDALVAISAPGTSLNVLVAMEDAAASGVSVIALVGDPHSPVGAGADLVVPLGSVESAIAEDAALAVVHAIYGWFMAAT